MRALSEKKGGSYDTSRAPLNPPLTSFVIAMEMSMCSRALSTLIFLDLKYINPCFHDKSLLILYIRKS